MHFLTLAAVEIPPQEENLVENKWVEEQKKELLEKLEKNEKKDVFLQVMLQRLNHLSTPFPGQWMRLWQNSWNHSA